MKSLAFALALAATTAMPAAAATGVFFTYQSIEANFLQPKAPGVITRSQSGSGTLIFNRTLTDGVYGLSDVASFTLNHRLGATIVSPPVPLFGNFDFDKSKLSAFQVTIAGGVLTAANWAFNPVAPTSTSFNVGFFPESVEYSLANGVSVYFYEPGKPRTLLASNIQGTRRSFLVAVPESATWIMMIAGFGAAGLRVRARRPARRAVA